MRSVTITAWKRPHYLERVLDSLIKAEIPPEYKVIVSADAFQGAGSHPVVLDVVHGFMKNHPNTNIYVIAHTAHRGVRGNPFFVLNEAFEANGSSANIYLEEDTIVSPDLFHIADWYFDSIAPSYEDLLCLHMFNYNSNPGKPAEFFFDQTFSALGLGITRDQWDKYFKPYWNDNKIAQEVFGPSRGWDWSIHAALKKFNLRTLAPHLARTNHIGREGGVHASPIFHDKTFSHLEISDYKEKLNYVIE